MRNFSDKSCTENQSEHFMFSEHFPRFVSFLLEMEKYNTTVQATNDSIIRRMRFACWINKAKNTLSIMCSTSCFSTAKIVTRTRLRLPD